MDPSRIKITPIPPRAETAGSYAAWMGIVVSLFVIALAGGCGKAPAHRSLEDILKSGQITVITRNNAHCYYVYREQAMGFEYDMAQAFADFLGVKLNVETAHSWEEMIPSLTEDGGDFIAASMTITPERKKDVIFSDGYREIQQHIIVHRNNGDVNTVEDLSGRTVHVRRGTSYESRLSALQQEGIDLKIKLHEDAPTGELIGRVAANDIEVTVADSNIALLNRRYYPKIRVSAAISEKELLGWAVARNAVDLRAQINLFLKVIGNNGQLDEIYKRYYADVETFDYLDLAAFHRRIKSRMPTYRRIIQKAAAKHGFDWRLIVAQIYQESHFNPKAQSTKGAYGLMQLTSRMADSFDVKDIFDPVQNIEAGTRYLKELFDRFDKASGSDRLFIAIAAYNIGLGHIWDARDLARERNLDPNRWSSLVETLPLLMYYKYNKNTKHGYARGTEPIKYIKQIVIYYDILKHQSLQYQATSPSPRKEV